MKPLHLRIAVAAFLACGTVGAFAGSVDLADKPMTNAISPDVRTNVMFVLDDSGSMGWEYMPDAVSSRKTRNCYRNYHYNRIYFNPDYTYPLPVDSMGVEYPNANFSSAETDGFNTAGANINLSTSFRTGDDGWPGSAAYYYEYTGGGTPVDGTCYADGNYTLRVVTAAQQQNFANWYSYYRTRMMMMKSSMTLAFKGIDDRFRIGYMSFNNRTGSDYLNLATFDATGKAAFYDKLVAARTGSGTPARWALATAGRLYGGVINGFSFRGSTIADPVLYSCQRNITIMSTDGFWNSQTTGAGCSFHAGCYLDGTQMGNEDGGATARPYLDASNVSGTLSDIALYYYQTDLRPTMANNVFPAPSLDDNVKYQHMNTFTIGLGVDGTLTYDYPYVGCASCDYPDIVSGVRNWPPPSSDSINNIDDLWHAAVNGRGLYMSAKTPDDVLAGMEKILAAAAMEGAGSTAASSSLAPVAGDGIYLPGFKTLEWVGDLKKYEIDPDTLTISVTASWSAQSQLDAMVTPTSDSRTIYMAKSGGLVAFNAANLATAISNGWFDVGATNPNGQLPQYVYFSATQKTNATPTSVINYIRGWREYEDDPATNDIKETAAAKLYRGRTHVLGDLVDTTPVYVQKPVFEYQEGGYDAYVSAQSGRKGAVYAGANDGMLHAFDADTGKELWAFVPTAVLPYLYKLADKNYATSHRYFVDGALAVGDVDFGGGDWHTVLIGGLGKGGRAYFAIDVTSPTSPKLLWEFAADSTGTTNAGLVDEDLGYTYGDARMTKLDGSSWVAVFSSGYNNTSPGDGKARLYVLDVKNGTLLSEITTAGGNDPETSGIGFVTAWVPDTMRNNTSKHVYAGDLGGRVWRFDMVAKTADLLTTLGSASLVQPVTARPELGYFAKDTNNRVIYVGTGRYLGFTDVANVDLQSMYAIRDTGGTKTNIGAPYFRSSGAAKLVNGNRSSTMTYNSVSANPVGWYMDFDAQPGERVFVQPRLVDGQTTLAVITNVPAGDVCDVGGTGYLYYLSAQESQTGKTVQSPYVMSGEMLLGVITLHGDGGGGGGGTKTSSALGFGSGGSVENLPNADTNFGDKVRRIMWRELRN